MEASLPVPSAEAWAAVAARDRRFDGAFVYAVRTTGIFCRPSCPARRPHRGNVLFFADPTAAARAGYRPCKRCRPERPSGTAAERAVERARRYLDVRPDERVLLAELARAAGVSPGHLQRTFKRLVGVSPKVYQDALRLGAFRERARRANSALAAGFDAGFGSSRAAYKHVGDTLGMTPGAYRDGGMGEHIRYGVFRTDFGRVLIAATERGVCAVLIGSDDSAVETELAAEFARARRTRDDRGLGDWAEPVLRAIEGEHAHAAVPLDVQGTDFQRRVWTTLRSIPPGETRSYAEVAEHIERPGAARAVARACATNRIAVLIPCHRVVRSDGSPGGYRWGLERKTVLLENEARDRTD